MRNAARIADHKPLNIMALPRASVTLELLGLGLQVVCEIVVNTGKGIVDQLLAVGTTFHDHAIPTTLAGRKFNVIRPVPVTRSLALGLGPRDQPGI
ncbi:MAG: hypothetical protein J4N78_15865 [Chloroflexi bacterium]|nr:hypothetical protein [Chloroflexota bacterium]